MTRRGGETGAARGLPVLGALGLLVGLGAAWWLVAGEPAADAGARITAASARGVVVEAPDALPRPDVGAPVPIAVDASPTTADAPDDVAASDVPDLVARFTGRLVDEAGAPLSEGRVSFVPDKETATLLGLGDVSRRVLAGDLRELAGMAALADMPSTTVDADGRFELTVALPGPARRTNSSMTRARSLGGTLVARAPGRVPSIHECNRDLDEIWPSADDGAQPSDPDDVEPHVLGDWPLDRGVTLVGRVVDASGGGLADVPVAVEGVWPGRQRCELQARGFTCGGSRGGIAVTYSWWTVAYEPFRTRTDAAGAWRLVGLPPGPLADARLLVHPERVPPMIVRALDPDVVAPVASGFVPRSGDASALPVAGDVVTLPDVVVRERGAIAGRVLDEDGLPLAHAVVRLSVMEFPDLGPEAVHDELLSVVEGDRITATSFVTATDETARAARFLTDRTDADGRFRIVGLERTSYGVYADAPGHEPARATGVAPGRDDVELRLRRLTPAVLRFVHPDGTPVAVEHVSWRVVDGLRTHRATPEDPASGTLALDLCPAERELTLSRGTSRWTERIEGAPWGSDPVERTLVLAPRAVLSGRVEVPPGVSVEHCSVQVASAGGNAWSGRRTTRPRDDGTYELPGLDAGAWTLTVSAKDTSVHVAELELEDEEMRELPVIRLAAPPVLEVSVTDRAGAPESGTVHLEPAGDAAPPAHPFHQPQASRNTRRGTARFTLPGPGAWRVRLGDADAPTDERVVHVGTGETLAVTLVQPPRARLTGVVTGTQPGSYVQVHATLGGKNRGQQVRADSRGVAEFEVVLDPAESGPASVAASARGLSEATVVEVEPGVTTTVDLAFGGRPVAGRVVDAWTGEPLAHAGVQMHDRTGEARVSGRTDDEGRFEFPDGAPAGAGLSASASGWLPSSAPTPVDAGPAEHVLRLERCGTVAGTLRTPAGDVFGEQVTLLLARVDDDGDPRARTVADGAYSLILLGEGRYELLVVPGRHYRYRDGLEDDAVARRTFVAGPTEDVSLDLVVDLAAR